MLRIKSSSLFMLTRHAKYMSIIFPDLWGSLDKLHNYEAYDVRRRIRANKYVFNRVQCHANDRVTRPYEIIWKYYHTDELETHPYILGFITMHTDELISHPYAITTNVIIYGFIISSGRHQYQCYRIWTSPCTNSPVCHNNCYGSTGTTNHIFCMT